MDTVYIGKIVSTHGIKGELRIISDFPYKNKVFKVGNSLWIEEKEYVIETYRTHKNYDMVTFNQFHNINDVLFLLQKEVFFSKKDLSLDDNEILDEELLTFEVVTEDGKKGFIKEIFMASETNKILRIELDREVLIPMTSPMIQKIDKKNKKIIIHLIEGI